LVLWAGSTRGPVAPPGSYQVRLSAAGESKTQAFTIVRNPLGRASDADLQEQFTLAKQISGKLSAANEAVLRIRAIKEQVAERSGKAKDARITGAADALTSKLTDVEGEIYQYRNRSSQDPLNFPIRLNNRLAALQGIVDSGDSKPTDQSYAVFKELSAQLDRQLQRLDALMQTDVSAFNKAVARKKLAPVAAATSAPR
jgi:transketolase